MQILTIQNKDNWVAYWKRFMIHGITRKLAIKKLLKLINRKK